VTTDSVGEHRVRNKCRRGSKDHPGGLIKVGTSKDVIQQKPGTTHSEDEEEEEEEEEYPYHLTRMDLLSFHRALAVLGVVKWSPGDELPEDIKKQYKDMLSTEKREANVPKEDPNPNPNPKPYPKPYPYPYPYPYHDWRLSYQKKIGQREGRGASDSRLRI